MNDIEAFVKEHLNMLLLGAFILIVAIGAFFQSKKSTGISSATQTLGSVTGSTNDDGKLYQVTNVTRVDSTMPTNPIGQATPVVFRNPVSANPITITTTTSPITPKPIVVTSTPKPVQKIPVTPIRNVPQPSTTGRRIWDVRYTVKTGDTLSSIAAGTTATMQHAGSGSVGVTADEIYQHSKATIDKEAMTHGYPVSKNAEDNIFPGEVIILPRWYR